MLSLNQALAQAGSLASIHDRDIKISVEEELLGIHEAVTKLHQVVLRAEHEEVQRRVGSLLIGTFVLANKLGIKDIDRALVARMTELKRGL